jgi:hypothetical protein
MGREYCSVVGAESLVHVGHSRGRLSQSANYNQLPPVHIQTRVMWVNICRCMLNFTADSMANCLLSKTARQKRRADVTIHRPRIGGQGDPFI